jgi:hypothetical protein
MVFAAVIGIITALQKNNHFTLLYADKKNSGCNFLLEKIK